jgi:hypothetical protein
MMWTGLIWLKGPALDFCEHGNKLLGYMKFWIRQQLTTSQRWLYSMQFLGYLIS